MPTSPLALRITTLPDRSPSPASTTTSPPLPLLPNELPADSVTLDPTESLLPPEIRIWPPTPALSPVPILISPESLPTPERILTLPVFPADGPVESSANAEPITDTRPPSVEAVDAPAINSADPPRKPEPALTTIEPATEPEPAVAKRSPALFAASPELINTFPLVPVAERPVTNFRSPVTTSETELPI
jgi:hypothetical protein